MLTFNDQIESLFARCMNEYLIEHPDFNFTPSIISGFIPEDLIDSFETAFQRLHQTEMTALLQTLANTDLLALQVKAPTQAVRGSIEEVQSQLDELENKLSKLNSEWNSPQTMSIRTFKNAPYQNSSEWRAYHNDYIGNYILDANLRARLYDEVRTHFKTDFYYSDYKISSNSLSLLTSRILLAEEFCLAREELKKCKNLIVSMQIAAQIVALQGSDDEAKLAALSPQNQARYQEMAQYSSYGQEAWNNHLFEQYFNLLAIRHPDHPTVIEQQLIAQRKNEILAALAKQISQLSNSTTLFDSSSRTNDKKAALLSLQAKVTEIKIGQAKASIFQTIYDDWSNDSLPNQSMTNLELMDLHRNIFSRLLSLFIHRATSTQKAVSAMLQNGLFKGATSTQVQFQSYQSYDLSK